MERIARKPADPLEQRDQLVRAKDAAYATYSEETQHRQNAQGVVGALENRLRAAASPSDDAALATARADYGRHLANANRALDRVKGLEGDLDHLHSAAYEAFAIEAAQATDDAQVAVDDFVSAWRLAEKAWAAAAAAWAPVCHAVRVSGVPPFPVSEAVIGELMRGEARAQPTSAEQITPLPGEEVLVE